ncbi:hypothetical protein RB2150_09299 [Rhodobacterales bacterium HTCC2150]|nr:hypothetical protein RB2150_09299 [Rhodobacterales bacterium HTCC2150] [Rhodobacteraceae bacterium HTCC2150]
MSLADGCVVVKKPIKFARNICLAKPKKESKKPAMFSTRPVLF